MNTLSVLLDKIGNYHPIYGNGLAMHLPMVLIALSKLGADEEKLNLTYVQNQEELEQTPAITQAITPQEFSTYLGQGGKYPYYLAYFRQQLEQHSIQQVLQQHLVLLMPGLAASAFHALIRLAYAVEIQHKGEIAIALAFWSAEYQVLDINPQTTQLQLEDILNSVVEKGVRHQFSPGIIVDRMDEIALLLKTDNNLIQPEHINFEAIRCFALKAFYSQNDFTLLHTVTGCHAFARIMTYIEDKEPALRELWKAIVVAYLSTALPFQTKALPEAQVTTAMFDALKPLALGSDESHKIKLFYTCYCEYLSHGEPGYYWLIKRML